MFNFEDGEVILIDKPIDWTSFDTVNFIRALIKRFYKIPKLKVGHAGTLDPLATGLLILCTGKKTKQIEEYQAKIKTYTGTILLGQTTPTFDLESEPDQTFSTEGITAEQIEDARMKFIGDIKSKTACTEPDPFLDHTIFSTNKSSPASNSSAMSDSSM